MTGREPMTLAIDVVEADPEEQEAMNAKGYCAVCSKPLSDGRRRYCPEHSGSKKPSNSPGKKRKTKWGSGGAEVTENRVSSTYGKLLIVLTLFLGTAKVRKLKVPDPDGSLAEELAMTDEEAYDIAKPLARFTTSSATGTRIVGPLVQNEDIVGAFFTLYLYNKRVNDVLRSRVPTSPTIPHVDPPMRENVSNVDSEPSEVGGVPFYGDGANQYAALIG